MECLCFVLHGAPAIQEIERSIAKWGYAHSEPGVIPDSEVGAAGLLVQRGRCVDTFTLRPALTPREASHADDA